MEPAFNCRLQKQVADGSYQIYLEVGAMIDTLNYILERRCHSGGWCFYQLDEPNAEDTYYALSSLNLMCFDIPDHKTATFLKRFKESDGTYQSIDTCFYCINGLRLLGEKPLPSSQSFLNNTCLQLIKAYKSKKFSEEMFLKHSYFYCVLCKFFNLDISAALVELIKNINLKAYSLTEKFYTTEILTVLKEKVSKKELVSFLRECEDPVFGFKEAPNTELFYMEQQYMGVKLCLRLNIQPLYPSAIEGFVNSCKRQNGGYARSEMGIATLKYTYYGLYIRNSLKMLAHKVKFYANLTGA